MCETFHKYRSFGAKGVFVSGSEKLVLKHQANNGLYIQSAGLHSRAAPLQSTIQSEFPSRRHQAGLSLGRALRYHVFIIEGKTDNDSYRYYKIC